MQSIHKLSVKSISHVLGTNVGLIVNTIQTFPHASITEFTKCPIISLLYHHYIEKKNVPKLKNLLKIAEHLFNHCKSKFLAEVNLSSQFLVFI